MERLWRIIWLRFEVSLVRGLDKGVTQVMHTRTIKVPVMFWPVEERVARLIRPDDDHGGSA